MKEIAEAYLGGIMTNAVVAVPAYLTTCNYRLLRMLIAKTSSTALSNPSKEFSKIRRSANQVFTIMVSLNHQIGVQLLQWQGIQR